MALLQLRQYYNTVSRWKPPPLSMIPLTLAFVTTFLLLLYISFTSNKFVHHKNSSSHTLLELRKNEFISLESIPTTTYVDYNDDIIRVLQRLPPINNTERIRVNSIGDHEDGDNLFFNDTTYLPPLDLHEHGSLANEHERIERTREHEQEDNVYHDEEIFLRNYKEMKKNIKIYIYPHDKNDPFANCLLPDVESHEPGGNYASESYFKNILFRSNFVTTNPSEAHFFYLPFSIASLRLDKRIGVGGLQDFIRDYMMDISQNYPYWNRTFGSDHFYVACHSIGRMAMEKVDYVKSNAIQVVCSSSYFLPNYFAHKDVSLPQIWPRHDEPKDLGTSRRKRLAFFAGAMNSPVRKTVLKAWHNDSSIFVLNGRVKTPYSEPLLNSKYCLHLKGFEVNTARIGDALYYGCVPVIIADYYDLPFMDILNWKSFSVIVTSPDIPNLKKILTSISPEKYSTLQANVLKVRKHFKWNKSPVDFDVFYMVMYELWLRRSSIRLVS